MTNQTLVRFRKFVSDHIIPADIVMREIQRVDLGFWYRNEDVFYLKTGYKGSTVYYGEFWEVPEWIAKQLIQMGQKVKNTSDFTIRPEKQKELSWLPNAFIWTRDNSREIDILDDFTLYQIFRSNKCD